MFVGKPRFVRVGWITAFLIVGLGSIACGAIQKLAPALAPDEDSEDSPANPAEKRDEGKACTQPAPVYDGCNRCDCISGSWACTLKGCGKAEVPCLWSISPATASSNSPELVGRCETSALEGQPIYVNLATHRPLPETLAISVDGHENSAIKFKYVESIHAAELEPTQDFEFGKPLALTVRYRSGELFDKILEENGRIEKKECGYVIKAKGGRYFAPLNLDRTMKFDSLFLSFYYSPASGQSTCTEAKPILLGKIEHPIDLCDSIKNRHFDIQRPLERRPCASDNECVTFVGRNLVTMCLVNLATTAGALAPFAEELENLLTASVTHCKQTECGVATAVRPLCGTGNTCVPITIAE